MMKLIVRKVDNGYIIKTITKCGEETPSIGEFVYDSDEGDNEALKHVFYHLKDYFGDYGGKRAMENPRVVNFVGSDYYGEIPEKQLTELAEAASDLLYALSADNVKIPECYNKEQILAAVKAFREAQDE